MSEKILERLRPFINYAFEEYRNRGLEEAARLVLEDHRIRWTPHLIASAIRDLKRDPKLQLEDARAEIIGEAAAKLRQEQEEAAS